MTTENIVMWVTRSELSIGLFQDSDFPNDLEDSKSTSGGILCIFETFVPISLMSKQQTSVSHSSTESEIMLLDVGLRTDGFPAFDLWDVVMEVLRSSNTKQAAGNCLRNRTSKHKQKGNRDVDQLSHVDHVAANAHSSQGESQFNIFEDTDAVIKMIIRGRSPTMRHASRTHRVALDWLFDRINLDPNIQIKYVDTKNQLADTLSQGNITHDEWDHLLRLLNTMNLSTFSCSHVFLSNRKQSATSKRVQETTPKEGSAVAKPRPMNLVSKNLMSDSPGNRGLDQSCVLASDR